MICRNCGVQNPPGDSFCGSCGTFIGWRGEEAGTGTSPRMPRPAGPAQDYPVLPCWNCGLNNPPDRPFCMRCGERLSVDSLAGAGASRHSTIAYRERRSRGRMLGIALGLLAVLLLAGGAVAMLLGGSDNPATPAAIISPSPGASPDPTLWPTGEPTNAPTLEPTAEAPTAEPATAPPAVADCSSSTVPTNWVNLHGGDTSARVRRSEYWCIHQVVVVPDPNFGEGRIRLRVEGQPLVEVNHAAGGSSEYPFTFAPAHLVPPRTDVEYRMSCAGDLCNAIIQIGYERYEVP